VLISLWLDCVLSVSRYGRSSKQWRYGKTGGGIKAGILPSLNLSLSENDVSIIENFVYLSHIIFIVL